jgi:hypothetical protein
VWRIAALSLVVAALTLWAFSGWTWWVLAVLVGGLIVVRLALGLFPEQWRRWAGNWAVVGLAAAVTLWLVTWTSLLQLGVAVGVAGATATVQLRPQRSWVRWTAAGVSVCLAAGCGLALWLAWRADEQRREASEREDRDYRVADMRPDNPTRMFQQLATDLAAGDVFWVCWLFDDAGRQAFTKAAHADSCEDAVRDWHARIESGRRGVYGGATVPAEAIVTAEDDTVYVDGCQAYALDKFDHVPLPGPRLGQLTLRLDPEFGVGYLVTGYTPCGQQPPGKPTSTSSPPAVLPSYPLGFASRLTEAIAGRDKDVCRFFTGGGRRAFAAVVGESSCERAIDALADQVIDPDAYATPSGATTSTRADGRIVVHACSLTWTRWGQGQTVAGPQLGQFVLVQPDPDTPGYLVDDVLPC